MSEPEVTATSGQGTGNSSPRASSSRGGWVRDSVVVLVVALALSVLTRTFLFQAFYVPSGSMLPTLQLDDRIVASTWTGSDLQRGDIVVFADPGGWLAPATAASGINGAVRQLLTWVGVLPSDSGDDLVKRAIGLGGDRVRCCDANGRIEVNGVGLDEPYLASGGTDQIRFDIVVPSGRIFVMGDNRGHSEDSRFHLEVENGTVPLSAVVGPVTNIVWPIAHWQRFAIPPNFSTVPAPSGTVAPSSPPTAATTGEAGPREGG